jgi:hypothetical protein
MLSILAVAIALSVWRAVSRIPVDRLAVISDWIVPTALGLTGIAAALATQRFISTRRTLLNRWTVAVVPADEFDATPETVQRFAGQLAQMDRGVRGWLDRPARALRIRLESDRDGRLVYLLEVPDRAGGLLRSALGTYDGIELRDPDTLLDRPAESKGRTTLRTELVLARPSVEPLAHLDFDPDPLQPFATAMAGTSPEEEVSVRVDLLPAKGHRRSRLGRRLRRQARRLGIEGQPIRERLGLREEKRREVDPATAAERRLRGRGLDHKLRDGGQPFEAQILLRVSTPGRHRAKGLMQNLLAAFESMGDRNWLKASGLSIPGLAFLGADLPVRRARFDRRHRAGLFRPARQNILTARELAGFLKPPTMFCPADNVLRSGAKLSPPPDLPDLEPDSKEMVPLGRVTDETGDRLIGFRAADTFFSYIAGRSRYGKTELAICQFLYLVRNGHGGLFLDPHADALERMRPYLDRPGVRERVVEINLSPGSGRSAQPGWNLFELGGQGAGEAEARVEAVVDAISSAMQWGERSTRAINLTTQSAAALAAIARVLPADICPTIFQLPTLLSDEKWRAAVLPFLPRASQQFWLDRFPRLASDAITPLTNLVDRMRASAQITELLGASESSYRVREAMDEGQIVLACPGSGGTRDRLVANLIVFDLLHAAKGRADLPPENRRPFWAVLDEVQSYDGATSGNLAALLEQSAKYGLRAFLLNQNPERLSADTLNALTTNRSHLITTSLNSHAAGLITREWGGQPDPAAITALAKYRFIAQVTHHGQPSRPFAVAGVSVEEVFGQPPDTDAAVNLPGPGRDIGDVAAHLETLDERIFKKLRELRKDPDHDTPPVRATDRSYAPVRASGNGRPR